MRPLRRPGDLLTPASPRRPSFTVIATGRPVDGPTVVTVGHESSAAASNLVELRVHHVMAARDTGQIGASSGGHVESFASCGASPRRANREGEEGRLR